MSGELAAALAEVAEDLGIAGATAGDVTEWSARGVVFARLTGPLAEFRLAPPVAAAARRTPDTAVSGRGPDWVAFEPADSDDHALDRASAWFASAWRRATEG